MIRTCAIVLMSLLSYVYGGAQEQCVLPSRDVVFVDTIEISDPIVLRFVDIRTDISDRRNGLLLVPRCVADTTPISNGAGGYQKCLTTIGYHFCTPSMFQCFVRNMLYRSPDVTDSGFFRSLMQDLLNRERDTVWVEDYYFRHKYKPIYYKGLESMEIRQRRFWLFLVKNSATHNCGIDEFLVIDGNDNIYIRVLVPITR